MKQRLKDAVVDTRVVSWGYDQTLVDWLGENYVRWNGDTLTVTNGEGTEVNATPGYVFARWEDGALVVSSPQAAARHYEPVEPDYNGT